MDLLSKEQLEPPRRYVDQEQYKDWPEYREHVGKIRCAICQATAGRDKDGKKIEHHLSTVPEVVKVSDAHHVTTRGAGGPDAENLVPLCRTHHSELHQMGVDSFQLHYNFNLRQAAQIVFNDFVESLNDHDYAVKAKATHQRILTRVHNLKSDATEIGRMLLDFSTRRVGGRKQFELLGFDRWEQWVTAPVSAGGLGLAQKTAYRYRSLAEVEQAYPDREEELKQVNGSKIAAILPLIREAESQEERDKILDQAVYSTTESLVSWANQQLGRPDPKTIRRELCEKELMLMLSEHGVYDVSDTVLTSWANRIIKVIT